MEALFTATLNPIDYFNLSEDYGLIEAGEVVDVVLLNANALEDISNTSQINSVIFNRAVYDRTDLDNLFKYVEQNTSNLSLGQSSSWIRL